MEIKKKAETFGTAIEKKNESIPTIKEDLRGEMASKEFVRAETVRLESKIEHVESNLDAKIDRLELLIKMLIGLAIFGITLANPGFLSLMKAIF